MSSLIVELDAKTETSLQNGNRNILRRITPKPKPEAKIKPPTSLERVFGKTTVKDPYFSDAPTVNESNERNLLTEPSPFKFPKDLEGFSYFGMSRAWRDSQLREEMKKKYNERNSYHTRQQLDLLNRLYVKSAEVKNMKTILDIDPEFFSSIEGRPVQRKTKMRDYVQGTRDVLRTKIMTSYREDDIKLIEENFVKEQRAIDKISGRLKTYLNTFEEFLYKDHTDSMDLLRKSDEAAALAVEKYETLRNLSKSFGTLRSCVYSLEEQWRNCKMYQKFLYLISPMSWRKTYDFYYFRRKSFVVTNEDSTIFGRYRLASIGTVQSLENLIDQFLDDVKTQDQPQLYFETPQQLFRAFRFTEIQNLNSLLHIEELATPLTIALENTLESQIIFSAEIDFLSDIINELEGGILWEEEKAFSLEELALELINGEFQKLIADESVLNLYVFVEDLYESRVEGNDASVDMIKMFQDVELLYFDCLLQLDRLPQSTVHRAETESYAEEIKTMKIAVEAAKQVLQLERLTKRLKLILEPAYVKTVKDLVWRSAPIDPKPRRPRPPRPLTTEETQYLQFFVDYCRFTDDPKELCRNRDT